MNGPKQKKKERQSPWKFEDGIPLAAVLGKWQEGFDWLPNWDDDPEKIVAWAMIERAVLDVGLRDWDSAQSAWDWMYECSPEWNGPQGMFFGFGWCCEVLDYDPEWVIRIAKRYAKVNDQKIGRRTITIEVSIPSTTTATRATTSLDPSHSPHFPGPHSHRGQ